MIEVKEVWGKRNIHLGLFPKENSIWNQLTWFVPLNIPMTMQNRKLSFTEALCTVTVCRWVWAVFLLSDLRLTIVRLQYGTEVTPKAELSSYTIYKKEDEFEIKTNLFSCFVPLFFGINSIQIIRPCMRKIIKLYPHNSISGADSSDCRVTQRPIQLPWKCYVVKPITWQKLHQAVNSWQQRVLCELLTDLAFKCPCEEQVWNFEFLCFRNGA